MVDRSQLALRPKVEICSGRTNKASTSLLVGKMEIQNIEILSVGKTEKVWIRKCFGRKTRNLSSEVVHWGRKIGTSPGLLSANSPGIFCFIRYIIYNIFSCLRNRMKSATEINVHSDSDLFWRISISPVCVARLWQMLYNTISSHLQIHNAVRNLNVCQI